MHIHCQTLGDKQCVEEQFWTILETKTPCLIITEQMNIKSKVSVEQADIPSYSRKSRILLYMYLENLTEWT